MLVDGRREVRVSDGRRWRVGPVAKVGRIGRQRTVDVKPETRSFCVICVFRTDR
jgi:hypothetical protein